MRAVPACSVAQSASVTRPDSLHHTLPEAATSAKPLLHGPDPPAAIGGLPR